MAEITLTFDNGPEPEVTPHVLDILKQEDILASFFIIGRKFDAEGGRDCVQRAHDEGHWIANHTYNHETSLGEAPEDAFEEDVIRTQEALGSFAHPDKLFRPYCNSGILDHRVFKRADINRLQEEKFTCVLFNAIVQDWKDGDGWPERALKEIDSRAWTTLVLHDIPRVNAMRHLDSFIRAAKDRGHSFTQEISPDSLPIHRGEPLLSLEAYTND